MPQTYTVKKGETLWGIAQKQLGAGSRWKELKGYTGKPEDLPEGTVLTIPGAGENLLAKAKTLGYVKGKSPEELAEIGTQLVGAGVTAPTALGDIEKELARIRGEGIPGIQAGMYGLAGEKKTPTTPITPATLGVGAGGVLPTPTPTQDFSKIWETEYGESGLEDVKTKIAGIDTDITSRKAARDQALLDEKGKPIPQWMITGRKALEIEAATGDLNRLIDQRNALAGQYNAGISEVERKVSYAIDYQRELTRQLEFGKEFGLEEKLYELKKIEAGKPTEYTPPTSYREWELAGKPGTFEEWLKRGGEYTPTQLRAKEREVELLGADIEAYKEQWAKTGDKGAGTREDFIISEIDSFKGLTPEEIRNAVYGTVTDEWLRTNQPGYWTWPWGKKS